MTRVLAAPPWFEAWFDTPDYHRLYSGRDDCEAEQFVASLMAWLRPSPDARLLDLGCGSGRHARALARRGFQVTGMDLAASSIREAQRHETPRLHFHRHDMRDPFGTECFDHVFSFFTSFGYFDDAGHDRVVANIASALRPEGALVLDYLNVAYSERVLVPVEEREVAGHRYRIERWSDSHHFFKRISIGNGGDAYVERVAKFRLGDFERILGRQGLHLETALGDYELGAYDAERSPRLIVVARKPAANALRAA